MTITTDTTDQLTGTTWRLDPEGSTAEFSVGTLWGLTTVHGRFDRLAGTVDPDGRMELTIEAASFDTGNRRRDRHLRSPDFFDCDCHPEVRFCSAGVSHRPDGRPCLAGELHAAGRRVALELMPTVRRTEDHVEIDATTTIDQHELGMTVSRLGIRTPTTVTVHARLRPDARPT